MYSDCEACGLKKHVLTRCDYILLCGIRPMQGISSIYLYHDVCMRTFHSWDFVSRQQ